MLDNTQLSVEKTIYGLDSSQKKKRLKWLGVAIGLLVLLTVFVFTGSRLNAKNVTNYQTKPVEVGDFVITVTATGNLEATNQVEVGSEISGMITSMTADYNDMVTARQPLAYLDDAKYKAAVAKSKAEVTSAQANYREAMALRNAAEKTLKRYRKTRELTNGKLPSLEDLEQAEADFECAIASLEAKDAAVEIAKAALQSDQTDLKKTIIYAPISGIVLSRDVEPGQTVAASLEAPVLYTLAEDLRRMELQVDVDEADVGQVKEGQTATFTVDAYPERTFTATITKVYYGAEENDGVVTYKAVLKVENPDLLLRPGMTATASIIVQKIENSLLVPNMALRFAPLKPEAQPPGENTDQKRGILGALIPGPPPPGFAKKNTANGNEPPPHGAPSLVWILEKNQLVPIKVKKGASDGVITAVESKELKQGMPLVVGQTTVERKSDG